VKASAERDDLSVMQKQTPWLETLASWTVDLHGDQLPEKVNKRLAESALDWWGALSAGTNHHMAETYRSALVTPFGTPVSCSEGGSVAGWSGYFDLEHAAAANAAISHLVEVDDGHRMAMMHPGVTVFPIVIALAEKYQIPSADLRAAVVAGYEVGLRVGALLGKEHYSTCHTTATAGSFGAAAAAARLLKLTKQQTLHAFGHAGTQAAGLWQILDDNAETAKALHPGLATRNGLTAVALAKNNIPAAQRIIEGRRGMLSAWHLQGDKAILTEEPSDCYQIETTTIKGWPVCGQMHSSLDGLRDLLADIKERDRVKHIHVICPQAQLDIANIAMPKSFEEAKFSSRFCLAFLLHEGELDFVNFTPEALQNDAVWDLMQRIELREDPQFTDRFPKERPAKVEVHLLNGKVLTQERSYRRGDPEDPWDWSALQARFTSLTPQLSNRARDRVFNWCAGFGIVENKGSETIKDIFESLVLSSGKN
jgi:2-methylcitrate dehydratase PrpD